MSTKYTARQGDCMNSIAFCHGFFPDTLWLHPDNRELRERRKADNVLLSGDIVNIPDLEPRVESKPTEQRHRFKRRGVPAVLRIVFVGRVVREGDGASPASRVHNESVHEDPVRNEPECEDKPLANAPYIISGDITGEGSSD
jgi:hypothetical protein